MRAGEEKGGKSGGGATRVPSQASGESLVSGAGAKGGDGSEERGGVCLGWCLWGACDASLASTCYDYSRAALAGRRPGEACMPGPFRCGGRDYLWCVWCIGILWLLYV